MSSAKVRSFRSPAWYPGRRSARGIHISRSRGRLRQRMESISFTVSDARVDSSRRMVAAAGGMAPPTAGMTARTAPTDGAALYAARWTDSESGALLGKRHLIVDRDTKYSMAFRTFLARR